MILKIKKSLLMVLLIPVVFLVTSCSRLTKDVSTDASVKAQQGRESFGGEAKANADRMFDEGQKIFRDDTFGSETFWGDKLKLHLAILGEKQGGVGPGLSPKDALKMGLKVDLARMPQAAVQMIKEASTSLEKPETTVALLKANAVIGVTGKFNSDGNLQSIGIQCALCHSTVDDSLSPGIGRRLDGWPNRDLNIGGIVALAPNLKAYAEILGLEEAKLKAILESWGPGKYDAEVNHDGKAFRPDGKSGATLLPAAFGLAGVNLHTYTGAWGNVTYWNAYVANTQMQGQGTFFDPRLDKAGQYPIAAKNKAGHTRHDPDLVTSKLASLQFYQLALPPPRPPSNSFDKDAAARGQEVFSGKARCSACHVPPLFTEPGWNAHTPAEIGIDDFQANRSPDKQYRTTPLRGLFARMKGGFYHDGRFATLRDVIEHYNTFQRLGLDEQQKNDLAEYLKSL
jgi:hypothetical protein